MLVKSVGGGTLLNKTIKQNINIKKKNRLREERESVCKYNKASLESDP